VRLARVVCSGDPAERSRAVVLTETEALELSVPAGRDPLLAVIEECPDGRSLADHCAELIGSSPTTHALDEIRLLAPLHRPGKIVAIGLNYADHTAETGLDAPQEPLTFAKYPTSIIGPGEPIVVPTALTTKVDWEAELAVVIGRSCGPHERGTMAHIAAYTVANDVSARDLQFGDKQWTRGKSLDSFCPLGPALVTPDELPDPHSLHIWARVNDTIMQDASTADLIFSIPELLESITAGVTLEPGDLILTGTPPGVGGFRTPPVFLQHGDTVTVAVDRVGELTNPVRTS
jgi:2-keto-4-pentenoate hydratase/2-oxohepta-3-ene-1,7-dioic acid hydratase in catechol pathway